MDWKLDPFLVVSKCQSVGKDNLDKCDLPMTSAANRQTNVIKLKRKVSSLFKNSKRPLRPILKKPKTSTEAEGEAEVQINVEDHEQDELQQQQQPLNSASEAVRDETGGTNSRQKANLQKISSVPSGLFWQN